MLSLLSTPLLRVPRTQGPRSSFCQCFSKHKAVVVQWLFAHTYILTQGRSHTRSHHNTALTQGTMSVLTQDLHVPASSMLSRSTNHGFWRLALHGLSMAYNVWHRDILTPGRIRRLSTLLQHCFRSVDVVWGLSYI